MFQNALGGGKANELYYIRLPTDRANICQSCIHIVCCLHAHKGGKVVFVDDMQRNIGLALGSLFPPRNLSV